MQPQVSVLDNGLTVITDYNPHTPLVFASIGFRVGSLQDFIYPGSPHTRGDVEREYMNGLAHFAEHIVAHGLGHNGPDGRSAGLNEIQRRHGFSSNTTNFSTGENATHFYATGRKDRIRTLLPIYADMLVHARPDRDSVEFERRRIVHEMEIEQHTTRRKAGMAFNRARYGDNSVMGEMQGGTPETLSRISVDDLAEHLRRHYTSDNCAFVTSGNMSHEEACAFADYHLAGLPRGVLNQPVLPQRVHGDVFKDNKLRQDYADVEICFPLPGLTMEHYGEGQLIEHIVADRMGRLADRTGFYGISTSLNWASGRDLFIRISYNCKPHEVGAVAFDIADDLAVLHNRLSRPFIDEMRCELLAIADNENLVEAGNPAVRGHRLVYEFSRGEPLCADKYDVRDIASVPYRDIDETMRLMLTSRPDVLVYGPPHCDAPTGAALERRLRGQLVSNDTEWAPSPPQGYPRAAMG